MSRVISPEVLCGFREPTLLARSLAIFSERGRIPNCVQFAATRPLSGSRHGELLHAAIEICGKIAAGPSDWNLITSVW